MTRCISVSLKKNEVVIKIDENAEYSKILESIRKKMISLKKLYKDEKNPIRVTGRILKRKEVNEIQSIINEYLDVEVNFDTPKTLGLHSIKKAFNQDILTSETKFHRGSLRSGQKIETEGSIVILGDVNSGAEVIASENIIVLGALRGLAHAGANGNKGAIIAAGVLEAVQLRIANIVKEMDREEEYIHKQAYIFVQKEQIVIE